jgi:hypothetical protein
MVLQWLMDLISEEEEKQADSHDAGVSLNSPSRQCHVNSFRLQRYPPALLRASASYHSRAQNSDIKKFLPWHYFDFICGSSTGSCVRRPHERSGLTLLGLLLSCLVASE